MERSLIYNGTITAEQFLFYEIRIASKYYLDGTSVEDAIEEIKKNNLFQYPTERLVARMVRSCYKRLDALDDEQLRQELSSAPAEIAKQINLYAMMRYNRIVWDFMVGVGVMLHQVKAVTADFVLVNGVPRPDVTGNRQSGGIGVHLKILLLGSFLLLLLLRDHGDRHNLIAQLDKLLRHFEVFRELLHLLYGQRAKAVIRQADYHECSGNDVVDVTVFITQSAVQRQTFQLAFLVAD